MREKLRRYGKRVMVFICTLVIFAGSIFSFSFESKADDIPTFVFNASEPAKSANQGYLVLVVKKVSTGVLYPYVFGWNTYAVNEEGALGASYMYLTLSNSSVEFAPAGNAGSNPSAYYNLYRFGSDGTFFWRANSSSQRYVEDFTSSFQIVGWKYYGNVGYINNLNGGMLFNVYFEPTQEGALLSDILYTLAQSHNVSVDIYNRINSIMYSVDNISGRVTSIVGYLQTVESQLGMIKDSIRSLYGKVDELYGEQKDTNTWLEKIWNSIQEFLTGEPADDAVPDNSENEDMLGSMQESEEVLLPDTSEAEKSLDVQFNSGFGVLTWLVESFAQMDAGVFSMFLTMLTFGVMALLLGR